MLCQAAKNFSERNPTPGKLSNGVASSAFAARQRADIAKQSVFRMDAKEEPPRMGSRRLCVQYRLVAAWRFGSNVLADSDETNTVVKVHSSLFKVAF
jgi:hypothetical protein